MFHTEPFENFYINRNDKSSKSRERKSELMFVMREIGLLLNESPPKRPDNIDELQTWYDAIEALGLKAKHCLQSLLKHPINTSTVLTFTTVHTKLREYHTFHSQAESAKNNVGNLVTETKSNTKRSCTMVVDDERDVFKEAVEEGGTVVTETKPNKKPSKKRSRTNILDDELDDFKDALEDEI